MPDREVPKREVWRAALLLVALVAIVQHDVIFLGRSLIATNYRNPVDDRPVPENFGPHVVPYTEWTERNLSTYANIRDPAATWWQWEPATQFLKQAIRDREWPFWDLYIAAGTPAMANLVPEFFFPPFLVVVLLGATPALLNVYFVLLTWFASFATFLFVRRHHVAFGAAMTSAVAVLLSGAVHQHLGTFIGQTAACFPLVLLATRWFFDLPTGQRAVGMSLIYAMTALASFPPLLLAMFGIAALYGLTVLWNEFDGRDRWRAAGYWICALAVSVGLVAFYYLPALAARAASPQMAEYYGSAGLETMPAVHLYQLISGTLMGGSTTYLIPPIKTSGPYIPYIGLTAIALALLARAGGDPRRRSLLIASGIAVAGIVLKLVGSPVVQWSGGLPTLREIHIVHYFGVPVGMLIACVAGVGVQSLLEGTMTRARAAVVAVAALVAAESLWRVAEAHGALTSRVAEYWLRDWRVLASVTVGTAALIVVSALLNGGPRVRAAMAAGLAALVAGDGLFNGWYPNPAAWNMFDHPAPYVRALQQRDGLERAFTFGAPNANLNSAFRIFTLDSLMAFNPPRVHRLYHRYSAPRPEAFLREASQIPPEPVLDRSNVGIIAVNLAFSDVVQQAVSRGYTQIFHDGLFGLFARQTLPRFMFSSDYQIVSTGDALEAIGSGDSRQIVLEQQPGVAAAPNTPADPSVRVESYRRNSATVVVDAPRPGLLYAAESYFPGWTATVNGAPVDILPANYAFRAVAVPAGRSQVVFRYWPPGLTAGLAVSGISMLALCALAFAARSGLKKP